MKKHGLTFWLLLFFLTASHVAATSETSVTNEVLMPSTQYARYLDDDSWEPFNRFLFGILDGIVTYIACPFDWVYSSIVPKPLVKGIDNAVKNSEYPERLFASLFRAEWRASWQETERFLLNTTVGLGGLFDPAVNVFHIPSSDASFAGTFRAWGIPGGPTLAVPFTTRINLRDNIGWVADECLDPKNAIDWFFPTGTFLQWTWALWPNYAPVWCPTWQNYMESRADRYRVYMSAMAVRSDALDDLTSYRFVNQLVAAALPDPRPAVHAPCVKPTGLRGKWCSIPGFAPRSPALDSLRASLFKPLAHDDFWWCRHSLFNRDFANEVEHRECTLPGGLLPERYGFVPAASDEDDDVRATSLVIVIPGLNGTYDSENVLAFAELLRQHGHAVLLCNSLFNARTMLAVNGGALPGYLPADALRYAAFLDRAIRDLIAEERIDGHPAVSVMGWSMGGLVTSHLAAGPSAFATRVKRFVAINPPVDLRHATDTILQTLEDTRRIPPGERSQRVAAATVRLMGWQALDHPRHRPEEPSRDEFGDLWDYSPLLSDREARVTIAQAFAFTIPEILAERHRVTPLPGVAAEITPFSRREFYRELGPLPMREYFTRYLPSAYPGTEPDELAAAGTLKAVAPKLAADARYTLVHTADDFLLTDDDRRFLDRTFGPRMVWFDCGGHCGMFNTLPFEREIVRCVGE